MKIELCTILINESETERQTISFDTEDGMLYTDADGGMPVDETIYESVEQAQDACYIMWGTQYCWDLEWIEH